MTRTAAIVALLIALFLPAQAGAVVTGDWGKYAALSHQFRMPLPTAYVHTSACPDNSAANCADPTSAEAWVSSDADQFTLAHELGHLFDAQYLTDRDRAWLRLVMRAPGGDWDDAWGAREWFADYYALCSVKLPKHSSFEGYISPPPATRVQRVCFAILAAASR